MFDYYKLDIIPIILNRFKVKDIVLCGISDKNTLNQVLNYCETNSSTYIAIDLEQFAENIINDYPLNVLPQLHNFDAIFIGDDANWYTVYTELNYIKQNNEEFPLVFICNNIFPFKRRDSYNNPKRIPDKYINSYSKEFPYNNISIVDGLYHAMDENTAKNGVLTAIEDFLSENKSISLLDIKLSNGTTILCPKNSISQIRLNMLNEEIEGYNIDYDILSEVMIENRILTNYLTKYDYLKDTGRLKDEINQKDEKINEYEYKIKLHSEELNLINSQINNFDSKLDLKDSHIKQLEAKLMNSDTELNNVNLQLQNMNNQLKNTIEQKNKSESDLKYKLKVANDTLKENKNQIDYKNNNIHIKQKEIIAKEKELSEIKSTLNTLKDGFNTQLAKLDNKEYCISCYQEEISNNRLEIQYLKKESILKKVLNPLSYAYLFFKSSPRELSLNLKLYKLLKSSKCFDLGYYLNYNEDIRDSKWCKYFSPELHYVCHGFNEKRAFNKKYFNTESKKELLEYIKKCNY